MKISHTQLESCLANPSGWYRASLAAVPHPYMMGYDRVLRLSITRFHKSSRPSDARQYLAEMIRKHNLTNVDRIREIETNLDRYIKWATTQRLKVADTKLNIAYQVGSIELRGEVGRVDVTSLGYRAILFGSAPADWEKQLRMPLIQSAIAEIYSRSREKTTVGFQKLDASSLATTTYSEAEIQRAERRFRALGRTLNEIAETK
jgi:hypothetical protein